MFLYTILQVVVGFCYRNLQGLSVYIFLAYMKEDTLTDLIGLYL